MVFIISVLRQESLEFSYSVPLHFLLIETSVFVYLTRFARAARLRSHRHQPPKQNRQLQDL